MSVHARHTAPVRRAYLMTELLATITAGTVILGISVSVLGLLDRDERAGRDHVHQTLVDQRLAEQFRADVHAASGSMPEAKGLLCRLPIGGGRVATYRLRQAIVERDETAGDRAVRHESYPLPPEHAVRVSFSRDRDRSMATLSIAPATALPGSRELRIDAVFGRDRRYGEAGTGRQGGPSR